jgi:hypothetical protein
MPEIEDAGFEVPPAPWEFGGEAGGEVGSETSGEVTGNDGLGVAGADIGQTDSGGSGGTGESSGDYGENPELVYSQKWNGGAGESSGDYGDNPELAYSQNWNSGADYNPYPAQDYPSEELGSNPELVYYGAYQPGSSYYDVPELQAGNAPGGYSQGEGWKIMRDQYNAAGIGAGGTAPINISQGEGWKIMRDQYNAAGIGAGGSAPSDISQGEGWKIMRDQYNAAGLGAAGTAPEPQNRWEAATLPNLLAWGAGYGNAMGQTPQQMVEWANQSIQQWNGAHPDDQHPLLPPVVGPKMPAQPPDRKLTQTDVPWYDPKSGRWIRPGSAAPDVNSPLGRTNPSGPAAPEGLWAYVQGLWRTLTDPRYARSQACGFNLDPNCGQWANRDRWPTSPGDVLEALGRLTTQANKFTLGPPLNPETIEAIERVNRLGAWVEKNRSMSERAETYQAYVTGTIGQEFSYNDVDFDGFNGNALLDAKEHYEDFIEPSTGDWEWWFTGDKEMVNRARRQVEAAQGAPIEWHFNEKVPAQRVKKLFSDKGIEGIEVIYDPMPADWGK